MRIGIDGNEANVEHLVGVSKYTLKLLEYFSHLQDKEISFVVYLREPPLKHMPKPTKQFRYQIVPSRYLWSQFALPLHLFLHPSIDVFFSPAHYSPRFMRVPLVVTIHDLSYLTFSKEFLMKDLYKLIHWTKYSVHHAKKIIAVSKTTKKDILQHFMIPDEIVSVVYNGFTKSNTHSVTPHNTLKKYGLREKKYLLYVGTLQPRKNIHALLESFKEFHPLHPDFKLVLVGKKGWMHQPIFDAVHSLGLADVVVFTGFESDEALSELYEKAFCFVLPSLYEGFGIPLLEAMSHGCPVISSHTSSLPEIGDNACLYFDPRDPKSITQQCEKLFQNSALRTSLIKKGRERVKDFSWEKCAKETLSFILSVGELKN